jgi:hypothetical protein
MLEPAFSPKSGEGSKAGFPKFHAQAGDQLDPRRTDQMTMLRLKLRTAFTPAQPVMDRMQFAGRKGVVSKLIRSIEEQRLHIIIYGDRGIGKTSIMHVVAQAAREARYFVTYVSCGADASFNEMFRSMAVQLPLVYHADYGPTSKEAESGKTMADLLPPSQISVAAASELCGKLTGTRALVFIDEFDRANSKQFRRDLAEFLKNLSDRQCRIQLIIAGVAANLTEMLAEIPSIRRNIHALDVPRMDSDEIRELLNRGEAASGLRFEPYVVDWLVTLANGLPFLASIIGQYVGLAAINAGRSVVKTSDVVTALDEVLDEFRQQISPQSRVQIQQMVATRGHLLMGRLAGYASSSHGVFDAKVIEEVFPNLQARQLCQTMLAHQSAEGGLIEAFEADGVTRYRFIDPSVPLYLWLLSLQSNLTTLASGAQ